MTPKPVAKRLTLWQPIRVEQAAAAGCFAIDVAADDCDLGPFIAGGHVDVAKTDARPKGKKVTQVLELLGASTLTWRLAEALHASGAFKANPGEDSLRVHCRQAVALPSGQRVALLCALTPEPDAAPPLPSGPMGAVQRAVADHQESAAKHAMEAVQRKADDAQRLAQMPPDQRAALEDLRAKFPSAEPAPPVLDLTPLVADFPTGLLVKVASNDPDVVERAAVRAIQQAPDDRNPPPRDGWYQATVASANPKRLSVFITWLPHCGLPSYPEVRAAAARRLPRAFASPQRSDVIAPEIEGGAQSIAPDTVTVLPFDPSNLDWLDDENFSFGFDFPGEVARTAKGRLREHGFECVGWYQPHHIWSEDTWGIYIDARRLDETACSIAEDFRTGGLRRGRNVLAAKLALMLLYQHELFHAKVEAALTWLELQALQPKFRTYQTQVYAALKGTDGHLEEALANFASWAWASADTAAQQLAGQLSADDRKLVERVVRHHLDLSPPGYRRWADGEHRETWRTLATQMVQGRPKLLSPGIGLPIEPMIREALPFDYDEWRDVPCRFVGQGRIASALLAAPATLNLPQRQEVRKVIQRHFNYELIRGAGKGSHEKFKHANGRMFPLPKRDPLSMTVFKNFLDHFALSKNDYDQIRLKV